MGVPEAGVQHGHVTCTKQRWTRGRVRDPANGEAWDGKRGEGAAVNMSVEGVATSGSGAQRPLAAEAGAEFALDPRETMRRLPAFLQPFLTWLSGRPLRDAVPRFRWTPWMRFAEAVLVTAMGVTVGAIALTKAVLVPLLPISWVMVTGGMRTLHLGITHHASHDNFAKRPRANRIVGELITAAILQLTFAQYRESHLRHHSSKLGSFEDDDVGHLAELGLHPGVSQDELWRRLRWRALFSPRYHARQMKRRLRWNFLMAPPGRRVVAGGAQLAILGVAAWTNAWLVWAVVWVPCLCVFLQASTFLQTVCEHVWYLPKGRGRGGLNQLTRGRFLGEPVPALEQPLGKRMRAWAGWWLRVAFAYLPARMAVLISDLPQHDLHHRDPRSDWCNAAYTREAARATDVETYQESWGRLAHHIDFVFQTWARLPAPSMSEWQRMRVAR